MGRSPDHRGSRVSLVLLALFLSVIVSVVAQRTVRAASSPSKAGLDSDPHLVGWWKFDETSGSQATDSSPQEHHATLEGDSSFASQSVPGRFGQAVRLDGRGKMVVPGFKGVTGTRSRTVVAWIKTSTTRGNIISWGSNDAGKMWNFGFVRGRVGVTPKGGYLYMNQAVHDDSWHQVAVTVSEAALPNLHDHTALYLDGEPAVIHDIGLLDLLPIQTGEDMDVQIGPRFEGLIDDLRLYDRALTEEEIRVLFQS